MTLLDERALLTRVLQHVEAKTTDLSEGLWLEPVENYASADRLAAELDRVFKHTPNPFCPSAAIPETGSYFAREAAGVPLVAVRGADGIARVFRNACRHRGVQLVEGSGCKRALTCPYHAWTYGLDGALRGLPDEHGFPGLDKTRYGLVPVKAVEKHGVVWVTQEGEAEPDEALDALAGLIGPDWTLLSSGRSESEANWKIICEGFLEGYHIRWTHAETFYPKQYDNLNVIESFGRNSRITFPYQRVEKLPTIPVERWRARDMVTTVYHVFPNVMISTFPTNIVFSIFEPLTPFRTAAYNFALSNMAGRPEGQEAIATGRNFVAAGAAEDREMTERATRGLRSGANSCFTFGRFEGAIRHFHQSLAAALADGEAA